MLGRDSSTSKVFKGPERAGDVKHSLANISKAKELIGYKPLFSFEEGIKITVDWYKKKK